MVLLIVKIAPHWRMSRRTKVLFPTLHSFMSLLLLLLSFAKQPSDDLIHDFSLVADLIADLVIDEGHVALIVVGQQIHVVSL